MVISERPGLRQISRCWQSRRHGGGGKRNRRPLRHLVVRLVPGTVLNFRTLNTVSGSDTRTRREWAVRRLRLRPHRVRPVHAGKDVRVRMVKRRVPKSEACHRVSGMWREIATRMGRAPMRVAMGMGRLHRFQVSNITICQFLWNRY